MSSQATTQTNYIEAPVNIQLFQKLFDRIPEQQKQIQVSKNLTLDFCKIMDYYDDQNDHHVEFLKYIVNHGSIYRDLVREGDLSEEVINKYALYGENNGLFFRGIIIDYFSDALESSEFVAFN